MSKHLVSGALAAAGTTGNNTHASYLLPDEADDVVVGFVVTAAGATPTVTAKVQVCFDPPATNDASATWYDVAVRDLTGTAETTLVASITKTAVGNYGLNMPEGTEAARRIRLVTSANTNITYRGDLAYSIE